VVVERIQTAGTTGAGCSALRRRCSASSTKRKDLERSYYFCTLCLRSYLLSLAYPGAPGS